MTRPAAWLAKNVPFRLTAQRLIEVHLPDVLGEVLRRDASVVHEDVESAEFLDGGVNGWKI